MTWGIKISKPGKNVKTCTNEELVMSSEFSTLKIAHAAAPTSNGAYNHNLGYAPAFFVSAKLYSGENFKWGFLGQEQSNAYEYTYVADSTQFLFAGECRYFLIFQDTL